MSKTNAVQNEIWPELPYELWQTTGHSVHMWSQMVGKFRLAHAPWVNHSWQATFYVTARGWTTSLIPFAKQSVEIRFDFISHELQIESSSGQREMIKLEPMSVAGFYQKFCAALEKMGLPHKIHKIPNEVPDSTPFDGQTQAGAYEPEVAHNFWRALVSVDRILKKFRTGFLGKVSPVHLFWGSFDLAVTRFSGRNAPLHPGGVPGLPDQVTREAYSHEVSSAGFWPGGGPTDYPAFYSYAYPAPEGFAKATVQPKEAFFHQEAGEFILPYDVVRQASDPETTLLNFLTSTYEAAANLGNWDRKHLECVMGKALEPRPVG